MMSLLSVNGWLRWKMGVIQPKIIMDDAESGRGKGRLVRDVHVVQVCSSLFQGVGGRGGGILVHQLSVSFSQRNGGEYS